MTSFLKRLFKTKEVEPINRLKVDMHSHLLPGIDDGVEDMEQSMETIQALVSLGYRKLITTPHVMGGVYKNDKKNILEQLALVKEQVNKRGISVEIEASAEYFIDESFMDLLKGKDQLLPIRDEYVLIETSFMYSSPFLEEAVFLLQASGFKPILAHPERYLYLHDTWQRYEDLHGRGVLFQLNMSSLTGYYSPMVRKVARRLIDEQMVDLVGTDCHGMRHISVLEKAVSDEYYQKVTSLPLLNSHL